MLEFIIGCVESELGDRGEYDLSDQYSEIIIQGCLRFRRLGALLRMDRSIQAEGTFGVIKYDRWYKRVVRRGLKRVRLELFLVSIGHNLYKFRNKKMRLPEAA